MGGMLDLQLRTIEDRGNYVAELQLPIVAAKSPNFARTAPASVSRSTRTFRSSP
jgi:hypothetical protein